MRPEIIEPYITSDHRIRVAVPFGPNSKIYVHNLRIYESIN